MKFHWFGRPIRRSTLAGCSVVFALLVPRVGSAQSADNVLLVINDSSPISRQIGEYYAGKRVLKQDHVVRITVSDAAAIPRADYEQAIEAPIAAALGRAGLQDRIRYIVLTKGMPLRISGTGGLNGSMASVDSELTLLYRKLLGVVPPVTGRVENPYFLADKPLSAAQPFSHRTADIYLVTRLDGFTAEDVLGLIDRAVAPATEGKIVLDQKATLIDRGGDRWLEEAAARLGAVAGNRLLIETSAAIVESSDPVMGYYSWGSNDPANQRRRTGLRFRAGAIGGMFVSTDARTFSEPPGDWRPSGPAGGPAFEGSFQSLTGDLIRDGITGVSGNVAEPFLDATVRPQVLFPAYLAGYNLAESFYLAMPFLSWQGIVVGDPLCAPFPRATAAPADASAEIDPDTALPRYFSDRLVAIVSRGALDVAATKLSIKARRELANGNLAAGESLLLQATEREPRLTTAQMLLAGMLEQRGAYPEAIARYRKVLSVTPQDPGALNNLAYALATRANDPRSALPIATLAFRLSPTAVTADTLAWVQHLLGDDVSARPLIEQAVTRLSANAEVLVHAATIHAALGNKVRALQELEAAEKIMPALAETPEHRALRAKITQP